MTQRTRTRVGIGLAILGFIIFGVELGRYWFTDHDFHPVPTSAATILVFIGGVLINSPLAFQIAEFVTTKGVIILQAVPGALFNRRATDKLTNEGNVVILTPPAEKAEEEGDAPIR